MQIFLVAHEHVNVLGDLGNDRQRPLVPVGVAMVDPKHKVLETNSALVQIMGISREDLLTGKYEGMKYIRADKTLLPAEEYPSNRAVKEQKIIRDVEVGIENVWRAHADADRPIVVSVNDVSRPGLPRGHAA